MSHDESAPMSHNESNIPTDSDTDRDEPNYDPSMVFLPPPSPLTPPPSDHITGVVRKHDEIDSTDSEEEDEDKEEKKVWAEWETYRTKLRFKHYQYAYTFLELRSGERFYFGEDDGKDLILPSHRLSNIYLRKLVASIPTGIQERLLYLSKFTQGDQWNEVTDVDLIVTYEPYMPHVHPPHMSELFQNLREELITAYLQEIRLRGIFRRALQRRRIHKIDQRAEKEEPPTDPITLSPIQTPVIVYDLPNKKRYTFEAASLSAHIESALSYQEDGFSCPMDPKNPLTNEPFSWIQLMSIYFQIRATGHLLWGLATLKQHQFNRAQWRRYFNLPLTMNAIKASIASLTSVYAREHVEEFIEDQMEEHGYTMSDQLLRGYRLAMRHLPNHWLLEEWKRLFLMDKEGELFHYSTRNMVKTKSRALISKQSLLMAELVEKGWLV